MKNATRNDGYEGRGSNQRYAKQLRCYGCNKPAGNDPMCDHDTGHVICVRKACVARLDLPTEVREAHYEMMKAKRAPEAE